MASRSTNTLGELIQRFMADLAQYELIAPDGEQPMIQMLRDAFLQIARTPLDVMAQQGLTSAPPSYAQQGAGMPSASMPGGVPGLNTVPGPNMIPR